MKYNYVIFGTNNDYFKVAYGDVLGLENVKYLSARIDVKSKILLNLYRFHKNRKVNRILPLPFKSVWNKFAFRGKFNNGNPVCFIFFGTVEWFNEKYIRYLRKNYKGCKIVAYFQDVIERHYDEESARKLIALCDLALSYNKADCAKYNINLYRDVYSFSDVPPAENKSDVCCIIRAKDRLEKTEAVYDVLVGMGLKCDFYITGVKDCNHVKKQGIVYGNNIPYLEVVKRVKASKVILEIMQSGSDGYTFRTCEAIVYGKKLITDNLSVKEEPFYSPDKILVFNSPEEINKEFFDGKTAEYSYAENLSPKKLLDYIDERV